MEPPLTQTIAETMDGADTPPPPGSASYPTEPGSIAPITDGRARVEAGTTVGRYVALSRLGVGGMGEVWAAHDGDLDRKVALKLLLPGTFSGAAKQRTDRLLREAQAMARLRHPNVVTVYDVGTFHDQVFVAMEFVEGGTLADWAKTQPHWREIVDRYVMAGRGLAAAHEKGLVHRDFKPDNVMLGSDGRVQVMDFGLARATDSLSGKADPPSSASSSGAGLELAEGSGWQAEAGVSDQTIPAEGQAHTTDRIHEKLTRTGAAMGTPAYMAPEQHLGVGTDARTDQFSFAVALYEALYGERPFAGDSIVKVAVAVTNGEIRPAPRKTGVPAWVRRVLLRSLAAKPAGRWPSMEALLAELQRDPTRRRNRLLGVGGILLFGGATLWGVGASRDSTEDLCRAAGQDYAYAWNAARAGEVDKAFQKAGVIFAADSFTRVRIQLDDYAAGLAAQATDSCTATNVRGTQSSQLLDLRTSCMRERASALDSYAHWLTEADVARIEHAVQGALALPSLQECEDTQRLLAKSEESSSLPSSEVAKLREETRAALARVSEVSATQALDDLESLAKRADAAGDSTVQIEVALARGSALGTVGRQEESLQHLEFAMWEAIGADHPHQEIQAALTLMLNAVSLGTYDAAKRWRRHAEAAIARDGATPHQRRALLNHIGHLELETGNQDGALAAFEECVEVAESLAPADGVAVANALRDVAKVRAESGDFEGAFSDMRRALETASESLGPTHPMVARYLITLGEFESISGNHELAKQHHLEAIELVENGYGPDHPILWEATSGLAVANARTGKLDLAIELYERSMTQMEKVYEPDHPEVAKQLGNVAVMYWYLGRFDEAEPIQRRVLSILESRFGPDHREIAAAVDNLAATLQKLGRAEEAIPLHERALPIWEANAGPDSTSVAISLKDRSRALVDLGRFAEAREALTRAIDVFSKAGFDPGEIAEARFMLAKLVWDHGKDRARAIELATEAKQGYAGTGPRGDAAIPEIEAWLAKRT